MVGVDHFGRAFDRNGGFREDRQVGLFFWPWIGQPYATGVYDATKILQMEDGLNILFHRYDDVISPNGQAHWWGEPLWGYYNSIDEWVLRKQMQMITMAGVDFIFFDHTNAVIYDDVVLLVCKVITDMQKEGWNPPRIVSYTHTRSFQTVRGLYNLLYKPGRYPDAWYYYEGKPLIIAYTDPNDDNQGDSSYEPGTLEPEILDFFHFFKPNWPSDPTYPNGFTWIEWKFPQPYHTESKMMNVTVASHPMVPMSFSLTRENWINWGRGWSPSLRQNIAEDVDKGTFFQTEWDEAIKADPPMVSVGGWNEWIAYKQLYDGEYMLCDAASKEYSRDIEPMKGGYQDAFYLQLIRNIRRYKGSSEGLRPAQAEHTIDITGDASAWKDITYVMNNTDAAFIARNCYGNSQKVHYAQPAPTDKLVEVRVAHDANNIYFYIKGKEAFSMPSMKENWLNIHIGCGEVATKAWESYDYVIGRDINGDKASVEKFNGKGYQTCDAGKATIIRNKDMIQLAVPRSSVGLGSEKQFYFKVAMGVENPSNIMNTYTSGSAMPMGRLSYMYIMNN
ncbi:MAG: hypothetical protein IJK91_05955 [Bacteroidales bacterium]|nr:hypothetical protein [Bacteroidales bacterium]